GGDGGGAGGGGESPAPVADPGTLEPAASRAAEPTPAVVEAQQPVEDPIIDVEVLDVRFVDPGDPAKQLGPCYRIEFRNNSDVAIQREFSVAVIAGGPGRLTPQTPRTIEPVPGMQPGQMLAGDIRLPLLEPVRGGATAGERAFTRLIVM